MPIAPELRRFITVRDKRRCAYCQTSELNCGLRMHIDHIIPEVVGGATVADNLCLACFSCNNYKREKQRGIDPASGDFVPLFNPVIQKWHEHFRWDETSTLILGKTPSGRATVDALQMNNETVVLARRRWVSAGWHPPEDNG